MPQQVDYSALARQHGGQQVTPNVDYAALAKQHGGAPTAPADRRTILAKAYDVTFTPPEAVTRTADAIAGTIDPALTVAEAEALERAPHLFGIPLSPRAARSYYAGAVQGAGSLATPGDLGLLALGGAGRVVRQAKPVLEAASRLVGLATAARGAERVLDADSPTEAAVGSGQALLGAVGMMPGAPRPVPAPPRRTALPPGARFRVAPGGVVAEAGRDIPMVQGPDGSFVRGVPAEYARREVAGLLPAAREAIVPPAPPGSVPVDPSFVRGVPAQYARREPRGLLQSGPRFIAGEGGAVAAVTDPDALAKLAAQFGGAPVGRTPAASRTVSGGQLVPAAVVARDVDPTAPTRQAITVRQFSGDPAATSAPLLSEGETRMLRRMRADLQEFVPQRGRLIRNDQGEQVYAHGGPGSAVGDDIRAISGQHVGNDKIARAIDDLLAGKPVTNKLQVAAIDAARGVLEKRPSYRGPQIPDEYANPPRVQKADDAEFEAFSKAFDEIEPTPGGEPGESGFITSQLAAHVGGGAAGAAVGAASGETTEERIKRGVLYGAAGAIAPSLLRRPSVTAAAAQKVQRAATVVDMPTSGAARTPRTGRQGQPIDEPLKGFEPFFEKFSNPLVRQGVERVIRDNGGFAAQRRGTIDSKDLGKFANTVAVNVEKTLPRGTALTGDAITSYARALQTTTKKVEDLAGKVNAGTATDADVLALEAARAEQQVIATSLVGARAEAGRALAAFNFYRSVLDTGSVEMIRNAVTPLREEAARIAKGIAQLPPDPLVRFNWLREQAKTSPWSYARTYYISNLLSGPRTHARNVLGNLFNAVADVATLPVAAGIDAAKSAATGAARTVRLSELPARLQGDLVGIEKGFTDMLFAFKHGIHPAALSQKVELAATRGKLDLPAPELPGGGYNLLNWPFRALHGPDALFRSIAREGELSAILFNVARNEGKSGQALLDRVADLRAGMTPEAVAIREQADDYSLRRVFLEEPGAITKRVQLLAEKVPGSWLVAPFIRITAAIGRQGAQFSPVGFLMSEARKTGRRGVQAQARATMGTMAAGYLFWLSSTGRLSGNGPSDPGQRAALMERGWRPNSVRVGDKWVSYQTLQPLSVPMAVIANATEAWQDEGSKPESVPDVIAGVFSRTANSLLDTSFLSGVFDFVEALKDPERNASRFFGRMAFGFVPAASAVRTVQQVRDPVIRQPRGFVENMQAQVPGLSESVQPRISRFGQPVVREGGPVRRATDPFATSSETHDPIASELERLGVTLSVPSPRTAVPGGVSRAQETEIRQRRGQAVRTALERLMAAPRYQQLADEQRVEVVERLIDRARQRESRDIRREIVRMQVAKRDVFDHPQYGRVRILGAMPNGVLRVERVPDDGSPAGRHFLVRAGDLTRVRD